MPSFFLPAINRPSTPISLRSRPSLRHSSLHEHARPLHHHRSLPRRTSVPAMNVSVPPRPPSPSPSPSPVSLSRDKVLEDRLRMLNLSTVNPAKRLSDSSVSEEDEKPPHGTPTLSPLSSMCDADSSRSSTGSASSGAVPVPEEQPVLNRKAQSERPWVNDRPWEDALDKPWAEMFERKRAVERECTFGKTPSSKNLGLPTGRVEQIHMPRPATPVRLPRPKVFIKQNSAKTLDGLPGLRERDQGIMDDEEIFFSDEDEAVEVRADTCYNDALAPGDVLSSKVKRAISNLRSISFQAQALEDLDTAWGQASGQEFMMKGRRVEVVSSRWRRPRGRISSKNGVMEFECYSEADARSQRREPVRTIRGKKKWRKERPMAQFLGRERVVSGRDRILAGRAMVTVEEERASMDKYVEFIQASAQRESRGKLGRNLGGRVINRAQAVFRRKWK